MFKYQCKWWVNIRMLKYHFHVCKVLAFFAKIFFFHIVQQSEMFMQTRRPQIIESAKEKYLQGFLLGKNIFWLIGIII